MLRGEVTDDREVRHYELSTEVFLIYSLTFSLYSRALAYLYLS
jgi:hypothetical protein